MWRLLATSLFLLGLAYGDEEFEKEDGVYALTDKNFDDYAKANPTFLTLFYAPGCYHCKQFLPVYAKVARQVEIPLVKVNVEVEKELAKRYEIKGYPTLKLWKDSEGPQEFDGIGMELDEVVEWVRSKTDPNYTPPPEAVVTLTAANFTAFVSEQALCLVEFYAPWCGHCKNLAPQYEKAARKLRDQGSHIKLIKVNAEAEKELAQQYGVSGFPTLLVMRHGRRSEYKGPRDANGIINHMKDLAKPAAKKLENASAIDRFMEKEDVTIVAFFASEDSTTFEAFSEAAEMLREDFKSMGYTTDSKAFKKFEAKPNDIIIFYPTIFQSKFEPKSRTFNKPGATPEELTAFFRDHCTPLVGKRTKDNIATRYTKFPLVVVYYNADFSLQYREGSEYWRQKVLNVAQKYQKDKYRFAVADEEEFEDELKNVGLGRIMANYVVIAFIFTVSFIISFYFIHVFLILVL
ncbi:protein disulfide-isomerase domain protein [Cooperia oncophora]